MSKASAPDEPAFEALLEYIRTNRGFGFDFPDEFEQLFTSIMRSHAPADEEAALRDASFEVSPIAQVIVDSGGRLSWMNQQARTLFKLDPRDLGRPLHDLELSYRPVELRSQVDRVHAERLPIALRNVEWHNENGEERFFDVDLTPLLTPGGTVAAIRGVGITFTDVTRYKRLQVEAEASKRDAETAYEELQSTVEELETTNEELQTTNEQLETMNEELQSTSEQLATINDELSQRTTESNDANSFLEAVLTSIEGGVVVVDLELRVTAWNHGAELLWGPSWEEARGQHLMNLEIGLPTMELRLPIRRALVDGGSTSEVVVDATNRLGESVRCRVLCSPLHLNGVTRGALLLMEDA